MLAEHNVALFNTIIPLIYQHLPNATVGNSELLRITLLVLLPDAVSLGYADTNTPIDRPLCRWARSHAAYTLETCVSLAILSIPAFWKLHCYYQRMKPCIIGNCWQQKYRATPSVWSNSFSKSRWLLFSRHNVSVSPPFESESKHSLTCICTVKQELMPSLMSILTSTQPSKDLIHALIRIVPTQPALTQPQAQLVLASLQYWSMHAAESVEASLNELTLWLIDQVESEANELGDVSTLISLLMLWWHQKAASGTCQFRRISIICLLKFGLFSQTYSKTTDYYCQRLTH